MRARPAGQHQIERHAARRLDRALSNPVARQKSGSILAWMVQQHRHTAPERGLWIGDYARQPCATGFTNAKLQWWRRKPLIDTALGDQWAKRLEDARIVG